jgi:hypothetical protein
MRPAAVNVMHDEPRFHPGKLYSRREIHERVGGSVQTYLPHVSGRVVAACLDPALNPGAPTTILVGEGIGIESAARMLVHQREPVPVFIKLGSGQWEYVGHYAVHKHSTDPSLCADSARESGRDDRLTMVIQMQAIDLQR